MGDPVPSVGRERRGIVLGREDISARVRVAARFLVFAAACFAACLAGHVSGVPGTGAPVVWPLPGVVLAFWLARPKRFRWISWPMVFAGCAAAEGIWLSAGAWYGFVDAAGAILTALVTTWLLGALVPGRFTFDEVRHVVLFALVAPLAGVSGAVAGTVLGHGAPASVPKDQVFAAWWAAYALGVLVGGPFAYLWLRRESWLSTQRREKRTAEFCVFLVALAVGGDLAFGGYSWSRFGVRFPDAYFLFPLLLWAGTRFGPRTAAGATVYLAALILCGDCGDRLPEDPAAAHAQIASRQFFLACAMMFGLVPAAVLRERDRAAEMLRDTTTFQWAILDGAPHAIIGTDAQGKVQSVNTMAERLLGRRAGELAGVARFEDLFPDDERKRLARHISDRLGVAVDEGFGMFRAMAEHSPTAEVQSVVRVGGGANRWVALSVAALRSETGQATGYVAFARDITLRKSTEAALQDTESAVKSLFNAAPMMLGIVELDGDDTVHISSNPAAAKFAGMHPERLDGVRSSDLGVMTPPIRKLWARKYRDAERTSRPVYFEYDHPVGGVERRIAATVSFISRGPSGRARFSYIAEDVTERREAETNVRRFAAVLEATTDFVMISDRKGRVLFINRALREFALLPETGWAGGIELADFFGRQGFETIGLEAIPVAMLDGTWSGESVLSFRGGPALQVSVVMLAIRTAEGALDFMATVARDITEQKRIEEAIRNNLGEKEALVREIHHRVKNNLQVVSSLLALQAHSIPDEETRAMFEESRERIRTMALIHEKLYASDDLGRVDFGEFLRALVPLVFAAQNTRGARVKAQVVAEDASFSLDTAIPLGLIVNELVSNSLKHAFERCGGGTVRVSLGRAGGGRWKMAVEDNGDGLTGGPGAGREGQLGLRLVEILTKQLGGESHLAGPPGCCFTIVFRDGRAGVQDGLDAGVP